MYNFDSDKWLPYVDIGSRMATGTGLDIYANHTPKDGLLYLEFASCINENGAASDIGLAIDYGNIVQRVDYEAALAVNLPYTFNTGIFIPQNARVLIRLLAVAANERVQYFFSGKLYLVN